MTRKDTIMIAVLVNAALLITLFVTAVKREEQQSPSHNKEIVEVHPIALPDLAKKQEEKSEKNDIEQVLKEFAEKPVAREEKKMPPIDFAKELEAITKATAPSPKENRSSPLLKEEKKVTVQKGDTLDKIARNHHVTIDQIISYNHLNTSVLQIGQILKIPGSQAKTTAAIPSSAESKYYTVKQGDNPWSIAMKNNMKLDELLKLNELNEEKARRLRPGDKLRIQ